MVNTAIKKLRNKFLVLLIVSFSMIMILAFSIIYIISYNNIQQEIQNTLNSWTDLDGDFYGDSFFTVEIDELGRVVEVNSDFQMAENQYDEMINFALNNQGSTEEITVNDRVFVYTVRDGLGIRNSVIENEEGVTMMIISERNLLSRTQYLLFLDVSHFRSELNELLSTLLKVGGLIIFMIVSVSIIFSNQVVKPIAMSLNRQKQFIANASHELKTPLTIIKSNYGVLVDNKEETIESQLEWLEYMEFGFERMTSLTHDLLVLAQLDNTDFEFQKEPFNLSQVAEEVIGPMFVRANQKGVSISTSIESNLMINQDIEKITQVMIILLDNAIKYVDDNGWIEVTVTKSKRYVTFAIKNSGPGIAAENLPKIFDRFYRVDASRNSANKSYGLGLAIAKAIIEHSGGKIAATSIENEVTTFSFTFRM